MSPEKQPDNISKTEPIEAQTQEPATVSSTNGKTSGLAIAALVMAFLAPVVGFILGILALGSIKKNKEAGRGLAISAIVVSVVITLVTIAIGLFFVIVIGVASNEDSLRTENNSVSISGENGNEAEIGSSKIPDGFPKDVPIYPGAKVLASTSIDGNYSVALSTPDSKSQVEAYYKTTLANNGWVSENGSSSAEFGGFSSLALVKDGSRVGVTIGESTDKNQTTVTISVSQIKD